MLDSLRNSVGSWFVKILLGLLVMSFAIWGVGDIFMGGQQQKLAEVGDREITRAEFERAYENQLATVSAQIGRRLTSTEARAFQLGERVIQTLVGTAAIDLHADALNLGISDEAVADAIRSEPSFQGPSGEFDAARFQEVLRNNNLNEPLFVQLQRQEMVRGQLIGPVGRGAFVPATLLNAQNQYRNDERVLKYFVVAPAAVGTVAAPDETVLKTYYEENKARYMAPEYRKVGVLALTPESIKDSISLSDADLAAAYESTKQTYAVAERRTVQQLVFKDMAAAQDAHKKLTEGADFVKLGEELGMKDSDINLGNFAQSQMVDRRLAEAAFKLEVNRFSDPIDSFRPVIARVTEISPGSQKSFEEVKDQVRDALAKSRAAEEIAKLYETIEDERGGGATVGEASKKLSLPYVEHMIDRAGNGQDGKPIQAPGINRQVAQQAFESDVGVENNPFTLDDGYSFFEVLEVIPERQKTFEEVRQEAQTAWIAAETRKLLRQKADELIVKAKGGAAIEAIAQEAAGAQVVTTAPVKREDAPQGLPEAATRLAFTLALNDLGSVQMPDGQSQAVLQVSEIRPAPPLDEKQAEALREEIRRGMGGDLLNQYVSGLQNSYGTTVNNNAISALVGGQP